MSGGRIIFKEQHFPLRKDVGRFAWVTLKVQQAISKALLPNASKSIKTKPHIEWSTQEGVQYVFVIETNYFKIYQKAFVKSVLGSSEIN